MAAVAHHQPPPVLVTLTGMAGDVGVDLCLQSLGQHPPRALADELIDQRHTIGTRAFRTIADSRNYREHGSYPSDRRWRAGLA